MERRQASEFFPYGDEMENSEVCGKWEVRKEAGGSAW